MNMRKQKLICGEKKEFIKRQQRTEEILFLAEKRTCTLYITVATNLSFYMGKNNKYMVLFVSLRRVSKYVLKIHQLIKTLS